jgi:hypothetical protein
MHRLGSCSYRWFDKGASARREHPLIGAHGSETEYASYPMRSMPHMARVLRIDPSS